MARSAEHEVQVEQNELAPATKPALVRLFKCLPLRRLQTKRWPPLEGRHLLNI